MHLLAIDLGTTSVKVSLFDDRTNVIRSAHERVKTLLETGGAASQNANDWIDIIMRNCQRITAECPDQMSDVAALAVTGHMMGCLPVDRNGHPLSGHMLHSDTRARDEVQIIGSAAGSDRIYQLTGNILAGASVLAKMMWLRNNHPQIYNETACFLNSKDFITGFLTGDFTHTDLSDASHAGVIDIHTREYPEELFSELKLDINKMPQIHPGTEVIGSLKKQTAELLGLRSGIPVVAGAGDGACSAIGAGAGQVGDTYCCMGTTAWIAAMSDKPVLDKHQRSYNIITGDGRAVGSYGTIQNCGRSTDFAQKFFAVDNMKDFDNMAETAPAGSNNLFFLPYLNGERAPIFDPDTQGVFFGLSTDHGREHGLRSVLEGVGYALKHNTEVHRQNNLSVDRVSLIGGGGRSAIWRKILASILPAVITRVDVPSEDATTLGAAILAGTGIGLYNSIQEGMAMIRTIENTEPNQAWIDVYEEGYKNYLGLYPALKEPYHRLAASK
jgi:xylulokinase